jgi:hypothetical protein
MDRIAQDALWLARALVTTGLVLLALGFGIAFGGAVGAFIAAVMVPGVLAFAVGAGIGLLVLRDEQRRARNVDVINLKPILPTEMDQAYLNVDAWLKEVDPEDSNGGDS